MIRKSLLVLLVIGIVVKINAQEKEKQNEVKLKISGFVNSQLMYDTRKNVEAREAMLILYPLNEEIGADGKDLNSQGSLNHLAMTSRLAFSITGPDVLKAKMSSLIETDFTGASNIENNSLRLRHAYVKMNWTKSELIVGQYWHPINVPEMLPKMASLNTGAPFHPFSRHIQVRVDRKFKDLKLVGVIAHQRDFVSFGPKGPTSEYLRNAIMPNAHLQFQYAKNKWFAGFGIDMKALQPYNLIDTTGKLFDHFVKGKNKYQNKDLVFSSAATAFTNYKGKKIDIKFQSLWGQNLYEHLMTGGYAISNIDTLNKKLSYTNSNQLAFWTNIWTKYEKWNYGIFAGYLKNLGSYENRVAKSFFGRGEDIDQMYRITPMVSYTYNNFNILTELEYTVAGYGKANSLGEVQKNKNMNNIRALLTVTYTF